VLRERERAQARLKRSNYPQGAARQSAAMGEDLRPYERRIRAPTIILHGGDDPLFPPIHARDVAANITGAELRTVPGMGHTLPDALIPLAVEAVLAAARRGSRTA
jgi:pimeloyl-ACP methyl ester carboxylesterase